MSQKRRSTSEDVRLIIVELVKSYVSSKHPTREEIENIVKRKWSTCWMIWLRYLERGNCKERKKTGMPRRFTKSHCMTILNFARSQPELTNA
jgi:hypothetical protein